MYEILYTKSAREDLKNLGRKIARRIIKKIAFYTSQEDPLKFAKPLHNNLLGQYRFRIGDYRAIFDRDRRGNIQILIVLRIKHRKDTYRLE